MVARNLLHKDRLEGFKSWLTYKGHEHRPGRGDWQVLQVRVGTGWQVIYARANMPEHLSVSEPLIPSVAAYTREGRAATINGTLEALDTLRSASEIPPEEGEAPPQATADCPPWE